MRGWPVDSASIPIGAGHFWPDVNVYGICYFVRLSFVLDHIFWYQIVRNQILYANMYFNIMAKNTRETQIYAKIHFLIKFIVIIAFFSLRDIVNKVTSQFYFYCKVTLQYSPLNLHNTQLFMKKGGTGEWVPLQDTDNLTPLLSRWHWTLMPKPTATSVYLTHPRTVSAYMGQNTNTIENYSIFGKFFDECYTL